MRLAGLQFLVEKIDGAIVAHDEFRGMGLSGVREFLGAGDVWWGRGGVGEDFLSSKIN